MQDFKKVYYQERGEENCFSLPFHLHFSLPFFTMFFKIANTVYCLFAGALCDLQSLTFNIF